MAKVVGYHRPTELAAAVALLQRSGVSTVVLGGGTLVNTPLIGGDVEVVDLQSLAMNTIAVDDGKAVIGATATLDQLADDDRLPPVLRDLARREAPSTLRSSATVGGMLATRDAESELLAALLVHDAVVTVIDERGSQMVPLPQLLAEPARLGARLITAVSIALDGKSAVDRTGRTPADVAIVAAVARRGNDGRIRLALTGVADTPVLVRSDTPLTPPGDFRGSPEYRVHLAAVLSTRVRRQVTA